MRNVIDRLLFKIKNVLMIVLSLLLFSVGLNNVDAAAVGDTKSFGYTGGIQTFTAPATGYYRLEVWGAQGGNQTGVVESNGYSSTIQGGYGGYATGVVKLNKNQVIYVVVGGQGGNITGRGFGGAGGYNGGGKGGNPYSSGFVGSGGGGGATHIATRTGLLSTLSSYTSNILIVAGGGGGASWSSVSGAGGGIRGNSSTGNGRTATGATQTSGYAFGQGQAGLNGFNGSGDCEGTGGGGGGYYGGYAYQHTWSGTGTTISGAGGSGYIGNALLLTRNGITKTMYCYSCTSSTAASTRTTSTTSVSATATSNYAKTGSGYAKITTMELSYDNPNLSALTVSGGTFNSAFSSTTYTYDVVVDSENSTVTIGATPLYSTSTVTGTGSVNLKVGKTVVTVTSTSETGKVAVYTLNITRPASSYRYLSDIKINGSSISDFEPTTLTYNIDVPYTTTSLSLNAVKARTEQTVYLPTDLAIKTGTNTYEIVVVSEDGQFTTTYTLNITKPHSSKLASLVIGDYEFTPVFDSDTLTYSVTIMASTMALKVTAVPLDEEATVSLSGFGYIKSSKKATITVKEPNCDDTVYTINITKEASVEETIYNYNYTGGIQTFTAPATGYYRLETWGAQGGNQTGVVEGNGNRSYMQGGYGAYSSGTVFLDKGDILYIAVGGQGGNITGRGFGGAGGYNGGGTGGAPYTGSFVGSGGGGGATHIATTTGLLSALSNNRDAILIVAGGGGGASWAGNTGHGGGIRGGTVSYNSRIATGATQTTGYAFGQGQTGKQGFNSTGNCEGTGGGGGGFYGGYAYQHTYSGIINNISGAGGSGYIGNENLISYKEFTKAMYCYSCTTSSASNTYTVSTTKVSSTPTSYSAKSGSGYARITLLPQPSENNFLSSITVKTTDYDTGVTETKTYTPNFDLEVEDYYLTVEPTETIAILSAKPEDSTAKIAGLGEVAVLAGENIYEIKVTAESGAVKTYRVHITREASNNGYPIDIVISGLVPSLCSVNDTFCKLNPEEFDVNTTEYYITVPSRIKQLWFSVEKGHPYQVVTGEGKVSLAGGENTITIEIESEDGSASSVYKYYVTRDMTGNTDLSKLEIIDPERDINYDPDVTEYYITVPNEYTEIREMIIETDDPNASYVVSGNENFETGMNQVLILVTAANGETMTYIINVYREKSSNVFLSDMEVSNGTTIYDLTPEFNKLITGTYNVTIPNDITNVTISATPEVTTTKVVGTGLKTLNTGSNNFVITTTAEDGTTEIYTLNVYREKNSNANLIDITIKNGDKTYLMTPIFDKDTLEYNVTVEEGVTSVEITATPEVSTTTYKLLNNNSIKVGTNVKKVMAIAEDGTSKTYTITITRPANTNDYLALLTVKNGDNALALTPDFDKETSEYTINVPNDITKVVIEGIAEHNLSTVKGNGTYYLSVGDNGFTVTVTSESGSRREYTIIINCAPNSNAYLGSLKTNYGVMTPDFEKTTLAYTIVIDHTVDSLNLTATPEVSTTTVSGAGTISNLETGTTTITIRTIAEDGTPLTYTVDIIKAPSNNANLSYLIMEEGVISPSFDPNTTSYTVSVPYEVTQGTFHIKTEDDKSTYKIEGNENFIVGENTVVITVTSEDGTEKEYEVIVTRQEEPEVSTYLSSLTVSKGTLTPEFNKETLYYEVEVPYDDDFITIDAIAEDPTAGVGGVGDYILSVGQNFIVITVFGSDGSERNYQVVITRSESSEARLSNIVISGVTLSPAFDMDTYEYTVAVSDPNLNFVTITTVDPNASYEILNNDFTQVGDYQVIIRVTAQDMVTTKDYVINVTKAPSNNNNLSSLSVIGYEINPTFNKATTLYTLTVDNSVNSVVIEATSEDETATISGTGLQYLEVGINYFQVIVTSESGITKTYTVAVTKEGEANNNILDLIVNNGDMTPDFDKDTVTYDVVVPYEEESLDLTVKLESDKASYTVVNNKLNVGANTVQVIVTAENGDIKTYTLNVTRNEIVSALLQSLSVKNYKLNPSFNSYITNYDVTVDNEVTSLDITAIPLDKNATYTITQNENFIVGNNVVIIEVTASDNVTKETYTINVNRQAYANSFLDYLYTSEGDVTPLFNRTTLEYSITVGSDVSEIEFFGEAVDKSATVTGIGVHSLNPGDNLIPITITTTSGVSRTYYVTVTREKVNNNYLSSLIAQVGTKEYELTPEFNKETLAYAVTVPVGTPDINITGSLESETASVTGFGMHSLEPGVNTINVVVTSEAGETRTYTITVTREASSNNRLIDLIPSVGVLEPEFSYEDTEYTLNLDSSASLLSFTYQTEHEFAVVTGVEAQIIPDGASKRMIQVTAEDGSVRTYTITVNKERNDNAKLANLYVTGYNFTETFDPDVYEYHMTVPNTKQILLSTEVVAVPDDANATIVKSSNLTLVSTTDNIFIVKVTAPDGFTTSEYRIIITKEKSSEANLNSLIVNVGYLTTTFNPNVYTYTWMVPSGTILTEDSVTATSATNSTITKTKNLVVSKTEKNVYEVKVTSEDGSETITYTLNVEVDLSSDATLSSLTIDKGYYTPTFSPDTYTYNVYEYVDVESIVVSATPSVSTSIVTSGNGTVNLPDTDTVHKITVTAEDGTVQVYTLNIHKTILTDKGLKNLGLNNLDEETCGLQKCILTPSFHTDTLSYSITVPYEYIDLNILAEKMNDQQTVKFKIGTGYFTTYTLPIGKTTVVVEVYDGMNVKTREYTLNIERTKSSNTNLKSLSVTGYEIEPAFDKDILEYTVYVESDIDEVEILAEALDPEARVEINGYTYLAEGNNDATVTVIAPDGSTKTYIVHIVKSPLYNSYLKQITVSTGLFHELSPVFKQTTFNYTTTVTGSYDKVTLEAIPVSAETIVSGTGEFELKTGSNIFTITATAVDGSVSIYKVNVIKENTRNVNLTNLIVEEGNLSPAFEKSITKYEVNVDETVDKLTIHAILEDPTASYIITGNEHLVTGKNIVNVIVMSADKSVSKTYQLTVYKAASSNAYLSNIIVSDDNEIYPLNPNFDKETLSYRVDLDHSVEKVTIDAESENMYAIITGEGEEYLAYGSNPKEITVTAEDGTVKVYNIDLYRHYNLDLKLIISDVGTLDPVFDPDTLNYVITLPVYEDEITFVAQKESDKVTVSGSGTYELDYGTNEVVFTVTAPDGETKKYRVFVEREASDNNYIESLVVHEGILSPEFIKTTQEYSVYVRNTITSLNMDIVLEDENATYEVIGNESFTLGSNKVIIRVTAQNGATRDYVINAIQQNESEFSNLLLDIAITDGKLNPDFDPLINYYAATVPNSVSKTEITVVKENVDATVTGIGVVNLDYGRNVFQVEVTSKDGIVNTYTLVIYREENSDATLSSLIVKDHSYLPIFNKNEENYTMEVGSGVTKLDITATPTDPKSTVEIDGENNLVTGVNVITIKVTAPDNITTKTYTITVTKGISTNNYLSTLEVKGYEFDTKYVKTNSGPYTITVGNNVNSIVVDGIPEVETTKVTGLGSHELITGQNVIKVQATSESGDVRVYTIIVNKNQNSDSTLKDIIVSDGTLDPTFNPNTFDYEVKVDNELEFITVTGIVNDATSVVAGNGTYNLSSATTNVVLEVYAEDGTSTIYTVKIVKDYSTSSLLANLEVKEGQLSPSFHKNTLNYIVKVPNEITSLNDMVIIPEDEDATYTVTGNTSFEVGNNVVTISVTSSDGSSTTDYIVTVVRQVYASNYLKDLSVVGHTLVPVFNKGALYYEVEVPNSVDTAEIKAIAEDASATITGTGVKTLEYDKNTFYVTVTSSSGVDRTYTIVINRSLADENLLLTLIPSIGELSPTFDPQTNEYTLEVPVKTESLTLDGTVSTNASVIGLGNTSIVVGEQTKTITVTSQTGSVNIYTIKITRPANDDTELVSLTPSASELEYSNDTLEYRMTVSDNVSVISFDAIPVDKDAKVTGNELTNLEYGENEILITVTAEDGITTREIKITVIREKELVAIIPSDEELILSINDTYTVTYTLDPVDTTYPEVEWISNDESVVTVVDGTITAVGIGSTTVQIRSTHNPLITATIRINVINKLITSSVYEINRDGEEPYVIGNEPKTAISDYIPNFDNNPSTLFIFDEEGNEITDQDSIVGSYMKIKLIIDDVVYDELTIAVRGDTNGDGLVTAPDLIGVKNLILEKTEMTYMANKIADISLDTVITASDLIAVKNYILNKRLELNEKDTIE